MSCCGRQRAALSRSFTSGAGAAVPAETVRYLGDNDIQLRGPASGQLYRFSPQNPQQRVSTRDAQVLLRSGLFQRA